MKANEYRLIEKCIEDGLAWGWQHAHKYIDEPDKDTILEKQLNDILLEVCEWFEFHEPEYVPDEPDPLINPTGHHDELYEVG